MLAKYSEVMLKNGILKGSQKHCVSTVHPDEDVVCTIRAFQAAAERDLPSKEESPVWPPR